MTHSDDHAGSKAQHDFLNGIVRVFLENNFSIILVVVSVLIGLAALLVTPREEDPQIVVPLADVMVSAPGFSAEQVEQLISTPLERILYQIDGVEYVYSISRENQAIVTVRFYVGQDRERSLVKLFKKIGENQDMVPSLAKSWVVKPSEIDDVPIVTLTLTGKEGDGYALRRVGEEMVRRLSPLQGVSRAYVVGGEPRTTRIDLNPERLEAYRLGPLEIQQALKGANVALPAGEFNRHDAVVTVSAGTGIDRPQALPDLVVGVFKDRPVFLKDVAQVRDGPSEPTSYVRHGWGLARGFEAPEGSLGTLVGGPPESSPVDPSSSGTRPAVTIAIAKQKGSNAVSVARSVIKAAETLRETLVPDNMELVVTRNSGLTADEKVNDLVEGLWAAIVIVIALLTLSLGWREALIVAVAVPVVFGLTLGVNLLFGYSINRVTLFALILALGLLVDDPIVDVENIVRHFALSGRASRGIVLEAVAEIRPPLISATLAVIVSFLPMFFITGMMGPYMAPMALNVPVAMLMSMLVAFTITPWLAYQVLKGKYSAGGGHGHDAESDIETIRSSFLYRLFRPMMAPLIASRARAITFLLAIAILTAVAAGLAAFRVVPLKMLPYDNKNELLILLDLDEGTTLERTAALVQELETHVARIPEAVDFVSYVGLPSPIDFNGLVRHYDFRGMPWNAEIRLNLVGKKHRKAQSHAIALRLHDELTAVAARRGGRLKIVELPPGPPVLSALVVEVTGRSDQSYDDLIAAAGVVADRLREEPGLAEVDDVVEAPAQKLVFTPDQEKAALSGVSIDDIAQTVRLALSGGDAGTIRIPGERYPLRIEIRLPRAIRSSAADLASLRARGRNGQYTPLSELGHWQTRRVDQAIYHKNLEPVVYVTAETLGRTPAECVLDVLFDRREGPRPEQPDPAKAAKPADPAGWVSDNPPRPLADRTFPRNGGGIPWATAPGVKVSFSGEGEWKITLDVFRDLGLAFGAALVMIYVILVMQTGSFLIPIVVMLAIPLTVLGVMPGFWLLNSLNGQVIGGHADPVLFTATAMIGMIALAGIVTRDAIILVDFITQSINKGRPLFDAIMESRVVRMRPILLTAGAAMLSSIPITLDPIFSGLAWSLIFGLLASTLFTLFVIPVTYWLLQSGAVHPRPENDGPGEE